MKTIFIIACLSFVSISFAQKPDKYAKFVDSLTAIGQQAKLLQFFDKEVKLHPKNESALRWLGYLSINANKLDDGEKYYSQAIAIDPECGRCYMNLARIAGIKKDYTKASALTDKGIRVDPKNPLLYAVRGQFEENLGQIHLAEFDYTKAVELTPENDIEYYVTRGEFYIRQKQYLQAITDFTRAIYIIPDNYYPYFQRSDAYYEEKDFEKSLIDINKAIELDSTKADLYTGRGAIYDIYKEYDKANADYSKAIKIDPTNIITYCNLANLEYKLEDMEAASTNFQKAWQLMKAQNFQDSVWIKNVLLNIDNICDTTKASYFYQRGVAFYNLEQYQKAVDIYTKGLKKFPTGVILLSFRGNAFLALKEYNTALKDYLAALQNKDHLLSEVNNNKQFSNASEQYTDDYAKGALASIYESIAECNFAMGFYNDALTQIDTAISLIPNVKDFNKEAYYNVRGTIFLSLGQNMNALKDFDNAILINKDFSPAYINRAVTKISIGDKTTVTSSFISVKNNDSFMPNWDIPLKTTVKKSDTNIMSALRDCSKAIEIDSTSNKAYYYRGVIKKMLGIDDYCYDIQKAKSLGYPVDEASLNECAK
jgi:tetratricopeptide (TPR) repeat protein